MDAMDPKRAADLEPRKIHLKDIDDIVQTLFRTNNQPTSSQRLVLKTFLGQTNSEIQSLKHEVKRLRLHINPGLNQIRDELFEKQQQANQCSRWLSAVRLLPPDVLIRIFEYSDGRDNLHSCTSILRLSHVCAPWRNAALMGRSLWNTLIVAVGDSRPLYRKDASSLMRHWFDKAGPSQLLSIHLLLLPEYGETVASGLVAFAPRIQSLNLELKHVSYGNSLSDAFTTFLTLPGGQFSSLETLRFVEGSGFHGTVLPLINVFDNSPLLRNVILKLNRPTDLVLPWHQLVSLEIRGKVGIHLADLTPALSQSCNLRTAILHSVLMDCSPTETTQTTFPHLQVFKLRYHTTFLDDYTHLANFLSLLRLPNLQTFELCNLENGWDRTQCQPIPFITMLPSPLDDDGRYLSLRRLSLIRTGPKLEQLLELLDRCPMLEELGLYLPSPAAHVLESLTQNDSRSPPSLAYLKSFTFCSEIYGSEEDPQSIINLFGTLVCSWIMDPRRVNALSTVEFAVSNHDDAYGPVVELSEEVELMIQKCCTDHGSYLSPIKVLSHRIRLSYDPFSVWGIRDPTAQDWCIPYLSYIY